MTVKMLLPDQTYTAKVEAGWEDEREQIVLEACEELLARYRIRPDFFCRFRENVEALQRRHQRSYSNSRSYSRSRSNSHSRSQTDDACSSNEAVRLQQTLRSLSSELVTLRNRLHVQGAPPVTGARTTAASSGNSPATAVVPPATATAPTPASAPAPLPLANQPPATPPTQPIFTSPLNHIISPVIPNKHPLTLPHSLSSNSLSATDSLKKRGSSVGLEGDVGAPLPPTPAPTSMTTATGTTTSVGDKYPKAAMRPSPSPAHGSPHLDDLIYLPGPLTEDAVLKCLHARFCATQFFTNMGPILLSINPYADVGNPLTLTSMRGVTLSPSLLKVVQDAVRQQSETGYPQAIILSGTSGSGKTYCSMLLLRQLFDVAGGGPETDAFKHLAAAFTVLRSLGSAKTTSNSESSRIGHFIEVQVTDGALYRTKIHCYFLDQTRVIRPLPNEKNYHIFYQMLAGLTPEERVKLNLEGYSPLNLHYLQNGDTCQDEAEDAARFLAWKACLGVLGIPFLDVVRVLAAVLLLGNMQFVDKMPGANGAVGEVIVNGETELTAVAGLLGVTASALFRGITTRTHNARGQLVKSLCDANMSNMIRDSLAKALYCRTVATIVRRANSLKRLGSTLGTLSSDSNESVHNQGDAASQHASTVGTAGSKSSKSMAALNNAVRHATDGSIGILDMFGFEEPKPSQLEHLCINLCAETMQHFYNTHIFKSSIESCRDEGIHSEVEVDYTDNVPCIDLISSLRTGLLSMLDVECSIRGSAESYIAKVKAQHRHNSRLYEPKPLEPRSFGIQHFAGRVVYDATNFLDTNKDVVPDDLVAVFHKQTCGFGFATHLFGSELKALFSLETVPRGVSFRISPTSHSDLLNGDEPVSTLTQDFHTRLDNLLRSLVHARPHFVRCVKANSLETPARFDRSTVMRQIRSLQVLETVNLMVGGFPHRMRFKAFNSRYRLLAPFTQLRRSEDGAIEDCQLILHRLEEKQQLKQPQAEVSVSWAFGKRHIFLSEGLRQQLETLRTNTRQHAATLIQTKWRGWHFRKRWPALKRSLEHQHPTGNVGGTTGISGRSGNASNSGNTTATLSRPRPQPIAGTPPPDPNEKCDQKMIQQTCTLFGLDLERPPPVPPSRPYTVAGNTKLGYPQTRVMKMPFPEDGNGEVSLMKGDTVVVVGASNRRGHLVVEHSNTSLHVPFQFLELKPSPVAI